MYHKWDTMSSALCYQVREAQGGGRAKPSGGRTPRGEAPEPGAPSADDAGTPDHRGGRGEAARPRRAERTAEQSSRGGDGGEDAPQPTPNQAGDGPETDPGRAGGRPAKRGALRPARGPGPPERAGESERPTRARAQQPRRGRRPTSAAEQRRAEALERSEKPSGRAEGSLPQSRAASFGERGRGRVPEAPQVLEERSRRSNSGEASVARRSGFRAGVLRDRA